MSTKLSEIDKLLRELEDSIRETMILAADLPQDNVAYGSPKGVTMICLQCARQNIRNAIEQLYTYLIKVQGSSEKI